MRVIHGQRSISRGIDPIRRGRSLAGIVEQFDCAGGPPDNRWTWPFARRDHDAPAARIMGRDDGISRQGRCIAVRLQVSPEHADLRRCFRQSGRKQDSRDGVKSRSVEPWDELNVGMAHRSHRPSQHAFPRRHPRRIQRRRLAHGMGAVERRSRKGRRRAGGQKTSPRNDLVIHAAYFSTPGSSFKRIFRNSTRLPWFWKPIYPFIGRSVSFFCQSFTSV